MSKLNFYFSMRDVSMKVNEAAPTIGSKLNSSLEVIEKTLRSTTTNPDFLTYSGLPKARTILQGYTVISNLHGALSDKHLLKPEEVDQQTQVLVKRVDDFVQLMKEGISVDLDSISKKVADLIKLGAPFLTDLTAPSLTNVGPHFVTAQLAADSTISKADIVFKGRFPSGIRPDCAVFTFNGKEYSPTSTNEQEIRFSVEVPNKYCYLSGELKIYYRGPWSIFATSERCYKTLHPIITDSPGKLTVRYAAPDMAKTDQQRTYTSQLLQMGADQTFTVLPTAGWAFLRDTIKPNFVTPPAVEDFVRRTPWSGGFQSQNIPAKQWPTGTYQYTAQEVPSKTREESTILKWGQVLSPHSQADEFVSEYVFEAFDGFKTTWTPSTQMKNPFISSIGDLELKASTADAFNKSQIIVERSESKEDDKK